MTQIIVFGPSTTYGAWDIEGGWVQRLRKYLDQKQIGDSELYYEVYNLGINGDTSEGILKRFEFELKQRINPEDKGLIILISIGINDSMINNKTKKNSISIDKYKSNVLNLISTAKKYTNNAIFVGNKPIDETKLCPIPWLPNFSYKEEFVEIYENAVKEICKKQGISFIDVYNQFKKRPNYKSLLADGVHPSGEGHDLIFQIVRSYLAEKKLI